MTVFDWARRHGIGQEALRELFAVLDPGQPGGALGAEKSEAAVQAALMVEAARRGGALWRNNSGATMDEHGNMIRFGLANTSKKLNEVFKSSDLIGITPRQIGGEVVGVFTAVEVKTPGWRQRPSDKRAAAQSNFLQAVRGMGGIGQFAQGVGDVFET